MFGLRREAAQLASEYQRLVERMVAFERDMQARVQRIEAELMAPGFHRLFRELHAAAQLAAEQGGQAALSIQNAFRAAAAPLTRGKAGGLARAREAWRYEDGTFAPESVKREACLAHYERYARGGRARAARALRYTDGTFAPAPCRPHSILSSGEVQ